jgi:hypothetical protein
MNLGANPTQVLTPLKPGIAHSHFDVRTKPPQRQLLAWNRSGPSTGLDKTSHL